MYFGVPWGSGERGRKHSIHFKRRDVVFNELEMLYWNFEPICSDNNKNKDLNILLDTYEVQIEVKPIDVSDFERPQLEIHKEGEEHDTLEGEDNDSISNSDCGPNTNPHTKTDLTTYQLIRDRTRKQTKPNSKNTRKMSLADQKIGH